MEAEGIIDVDADIENAIRQRLRNESRPRRRVGENAALVVGFNTDNDHSDEDSPLLGKDRDRDSQTQSSLEEGTAAAFIWPGAADFEGLPWYRKPSVG